MKTTDKYDQSRMATFAGQFLDALGSPLARLADQDLLALVSAEMPEPSVDVAEFRDAYWAAEAFSKTPFDLPGVNREERALEKFFECERACGEANASLVDWSARPGLETGVLSAARRLIHRVLGEFSWDEVITHAGFGPGATTSLPRRKARLSNKWEECTHITEPCLPLFHAFRQYNNGWWGGDRRLEVVAGNKVTTVPKNAKIDRVIAIEPDWNMFFQKGIGAVIRKRLQRRVGLLTPDAQYRNRALAQRGSIDGSLTTIDLSGASDMVSLALCEALLPDSWLLALYRVRSPRGSVGGKSISYEKISSMGNGFTFELETLIFYALARVCCRDGVVAAYGDDIVVPSAYCLEVILALEMAGFSVNEKKTWSRTLFRESCGGHYLAGEEVTPPYFRKRDIFERGLTSLAHRISAANRLSAAAEQRYGYWRDGRFRDLHEELCRDVPRHLWGPKSLGDAVLHMPFDAVRPEFRKTTQSYRVKGLVGVTQQSDLMDTRRSKGVLKRTDARRDSYNAIEHAPGAMFSSLWGEPSEESYRIVPMFYRTTSLLTYRWDGPAAWLDAGVTV